MTPHAFAGLVEEALRAVPLRFRRHLRNVAVIVVSDAPEPRLLGLYEGTPLTERSTAAAMTLPDRISIFQRPHEEAAQSFAHLRRMVHQTVWHELAHFFGMDERQVRDWERQRILGRPPRPRRDR